MKPADLRAIADFFLSIGAFLLMVASGLAALLVIVLMGVGKISTDAGVKIVAACVGASGLAGILAVVRGQFNRNR